MTKPKIDDRLLEKARKDGVWVLPQHSNDPRIKSCFGVMVGMGLGNEDVLTAYYRLCDVYAFCKKYDLKILNDEKGYSANRKDVSQSTVWENKTPVTSSMSMEEYAQAFNKSFHVQGVRPCAEAY